ncbi:hypothetical protein [Amorphus sp. 3PC139-8]|uniref:hypothetical protein n=1 Tax=Amorphus sp. 3PC139-8 TaxID=2735676 RepID=UPI00345DCE62
MASALKVSISSMVDELLFGSGGSAVLSTNLSRNFGGGGSSNLAAIKSCRIYIFYDDGCEQGCVMSGGRSEWAVERGDRASTPFERSQLREMLDRRLAKGQIDSERHARLVREAEEIVSVLCDVRCRAALEFV